MTLQFNSQGPQPTPASTLLATLLANVAAQVPDYTANLPGTLIEDISSTCVGALALMDQARVDAVNNVSPNVANPYLLAQFGALLGIPQGTATNTSVYVVFSGPAGAVIPKGFIVSDGTYQYAVQDGGVIGSSGSSPELYAYATQTGSWAVAANSVTQIITSTTYSLTVTNPNAGTAGTGAESTDDYRTQLIQSFQSPAQGMSSYLRSTLEQISGVTPRLVSVIQASGGWEVICGGGDEYSVGEAIYKGVVDLSTLVGSSTTSRNVNVTIQDGPNSYNITFVNPPAQTVTGTVTWNTNLTNFTAVSQVEQLVAPAIVSYINSITVGDPINELDMTAVFQDAVSSVLSVANISALDYSISINGTVTPPSTGTSLITSDPESYFSAADNAITVTKG